MKLRKIIQMIKCSHSLTVSKLIRMNHSHKHLQCLKGPNLSLLNFQVKRLERTRKPVWKLSPKTEVQQIHLRINQMAPLLTKTSIRLNKLLLINKWRHQSKKTSVLSAHLKSNLMFPVLTNLTI